MSVLWFGDDEPIRLPSRHDRAFLEAHRSGEFSQAELDILDWQFDRASSFKTSLIQTIAKADEGNLERLKYAFPDEVTAFLEWRYGDLAERWRAMGIDL